MKKIQFGSGGNLLENWDNLDLPEHDIRNQLKFNTDSIDFIFHEHVIEHINEVDGYNFLKECYRILKPLGVMRMSCPSIDGFINVYNNWDSIDPIFRKRYGSKTRFINIVTLGECMNFEGDYFCDDDLNTIIHRKNSFKWHKYLYTKEDLIAKLDSVGFKNIALVNKHESDHPELKHLERRYNNGKFKHFPSYIDITIEATK